MIFVVAWVVAAQWIRAELWTTLLAVGVPAGHHRGGADADVQGRARRGGPAPLVWLGEVSFAFYLVHVLVMTTRAALDRALGRSGFPAGGARPWCSASWW